MKASRGVTGDEEREARWLASRPAKRRKNRVALVALVVVAALVGGGLVYAYQQSEQTRDCTIESLGTNAPRRDHARVVFVTPECGRIRVQGELPRVVDPNCYWNNFKVGGRYEMTTIGFDGAPFRALRQRLVGPLVLLESPPGAVCSSDSWYIEDE